MGHSRFKFRLIAALSLTALASTIGCTSILGDFTVADAPAEDGGSDVTVPKGDAGGDALADALAESDAPHETGPLPDAGCPSGTKGCDGGCVATSDPAFGCGDPTSCSACALSNATAMCAGGACAVDQCAAGYAHCSANPSDGCETHVASDSAHCGTCTKSCSTQGGTPNCAGGVCSSIACQAGLADCDQDPSTGCEINTNGDSANCGQCKHACGTQNAVPSCASGRCSFACNAPYLHCASSDDSAGCDVDSNTDPLNCGGCGFVCASHLPPNTQAATCAKGICAPTTCVGGFSDCNQVATDGCEVDVTSNVKSCGACGFDCNQHATPNAASMKCAQSSCVVAACNPGYDDLDGNATNGCETPNPATVQPTDLALWLKADVGVTADASGVSQWADQSGHNDNALQTQGALRPQVLTGAWPNRPNAQVLSFDATKQQQLNLDLSAFASANGFTLLVVEARKGNALGHFIGAGLFVASPGCCQGDQGKLMAFGYDGNNNYLLERTCTVIKPAVPANAANLYQPRQSSVRFGLPGDSLIHIAFGGGDVATDAGFPGFACTGTYPSSATMSMSGTLGTSPDKSWYSGLIAEVILYKRALAAADLATLQSYLKAKWATP